jgi:hypothetical protein
LKFTIEIYATADDGSEELLHRTMIAALTPLGARKEAGQLLAAWKKRKANTVQVLNVMGQRVYNWRE